MNEKNIIRFQNLQQQLQNFSMQKQSLQIQNVEHENALKELDSSEEVYQIVGPVMLKREKPKIKDELSERKKLNDMRLESYDKQIKKLTEELQELQKELTKEK